jgi:sRNA-binding protein
MTTRKDIDAAIELLCTRFPKRFVHFEERRRPLKLGIHLDIIAVLGEEIDRKRLAVALRFYVTNIYYLRAQTAGRDRIDLDGNPAGTVTEDEAKQAIDRKVIQLQGTSRQAARCPGESGRQARGRAGTVAPSPPPPSPRKDSLSALREAARRRKQAADAAKQRSCG